MKKGFAIYTLIVTGLALAAWTPMLADYQEWIAYNHIVWFVVLTGPPYGVMIIGQDLLLRPWLSADLPASVQLAVWLAGTFAYYAFIFMPVGILFVRRHESNDRSGMLGLQILLFLFHTLCIYISLLMLRT